MVNRPQTDLEQEVRAVLATTPTAKRVGERNLMSARRVKLRQFALVAVAALFPVIAFAADNLEWAYPQPKEEHDPPDNRVLRRVPDSTRSFTQAQIDDLFGTPDWFPDEHPPMPMVVEQGGKPGVIACARCHFPSGDGHPEAPMLGGQSVSYLMRQIAEFKNGGRKGDVHADTMVKIVKDLSDEDALAANKYFSALTPHNLTELVETDTVPMTYFGHGAIRFAKPGGEKESLGNRIIVLAQDEARAKSRDPHSGFIVYVPIGSVKKARLWLRPVPEVRVFLAPSAMAKTLRGRVTSRRSRDGRHFMSSAN
jgi:hypothetical protein